MFIAFLQFPLVEVRVYFLEALEKQVYEDRFFEVLSNVYKAFRAELDARFVNFCEMSSALDTLASSKSIHGVAHNGGSGD